MQQQLAKLQVALEQTHADFNGLGESRARAELDADAAKQRYNEIKNVSEKLQKRLEENETELNSLQGTLRQVQQSTKPNPSVGLVQDNRMNQSEDNNISSSWYDTACSRKGTRFDCKPLGYALYRRKTDSIIVASTLRGNVSMVVMFAIGGKIQRGDKGRDNGNPKGDLQSGGSRLGLGER